MLLKTRLYLAQASVQARNAFSTAWRSSAVISVLPLLSVCSRASASPSCTFNLCVSWLHRSHHRDHLDEGFVVSRVSKGHLTLVQISTGMLSLKTCHASYVSRVVHTWDFSSDVLTAICSEVRLH